MLKDLNHDLVHQLSETSDSIWRMKQYHKNSQDCERCQKIWKTLENDFEKASKMLADELARHIKENKFD